MRSAPLATLLAVVIGGMGGPLVCLAESRASESQENAPLNERHEDYTTIGRYDHLRQIKLEKRRLAIIFEVPACAQLGHTQNVVLFAPSGHRLSNGLLAPITC